MDNLSQKDRKKNMVAIRSRGNKSTEQRLRSSLVGTGISGFQLHVKTLPGTPDFAFPDQQVAVFVDGCFWHGCPDYYVRPKSNQPYWDEKLNRNKLRDARVNSDLIDMGWNPVRLWEHDLKTPSEARKQIEIALHQSELSP